ncbi:protein kinase [Pseudanabaena sp. UWO311]|uniref:serine/threonine-protein kinase n=1 Tax=Pseudanabaena sp. UWO311 TaxID=2487337 RepID=UPI0011591C21|nr:serine/threonine-protein kinase [Pseudanabaena sp. UWO311]TYQ26300.1 protein kinase [Pseudanabaena sp. UWO311]
MSLCINPTCPIPDHPDNDKYPTCQGCGSELLIDGCYTVTKLLSDSGGFGMIYEATDRAGNPKILKILKQELNEDSKAVSLFQQEAFVLGQIEHAGIPKIETYVHHNLENGTMLHGIIMQKIEGLNLEQWINQRDRKPIAQKRAITWLRQLVEILALVHRNKYFHRDIKPANIMLSPSGQLVLIDFGTAREATHTYLAKIGGVQGITSICSVGYTAPEQEKGFAVPQSDFYALGCTMIHLVTGKYPLDTYNPERDTFEWRSHAPEISDELADLIDALIARKPSDRPINCDAILKVIREIELIDKLAPNDKNKAKRKSIKQSIKDSTRKPTSPILLTISVMIAAFVGLGIGTVIKVSTIGNFDDFSIQLPVFQKKRLTPTKFLQKHSDAVQSVALSPDGKIIASASDDGTVKLWELEGDNTSPIKEIKDQGGWVRAVVFLSNRQIITAGQDKNIKIIDIATGKVVKTLSGHTNLINNLAIAPASDLLVSGSYDNTVNLWQISTGKLLRSLTGHTDKIWGLAISPDGKQVISASRDKTVRIWDVKTGESLKILEHPSGVTCVLVTPDGKRVISGNSDNLIRVWDLASGKKLFELSEHKDAIGAIAITNDGKYLFSGGKDSQNSIHLWNLQTKSPIWNLIGHTDLVTSLVITPDNLKLISSSQDKNINIWEIPEL